jgi:hypothetical protein
VVVGTVVGSVGFLVVGLGQNLTFWVLISFLRSIFAPLRYASYESIWQSKVAAELQGRVAAARSCVVNLVVPAGFLIAGPLADSVFEPGMRSGGSLQLAFGGLVGDQPGAGMALLMIISGGLAALICLVGCLGVRSIKNVEDDGCRSTSPVRAGHRNSVKYLKKTPIPA